ncbi:MAG: DNA helicase RecQ [Candidatus Eremiobacteraeota bacterium]|nr:DNA helicase RecQ [Candidatus Eremiobacteraeota bacterium]
MSPDAGREVGQPVSTLFDTDPKAALKHHFGFDAFRPLQADIVDDVLAGRDVFALLPTGGGKSLCFQLPAVMRPGLTVVVSPLIALMKDQVDALTAAGIPATFLNSTLDANEARRRLRTLHEGGYRLLYLAPERLALPHVYRDLEAWNVTRFAIDEAHCISEWGHDFRPDYRRLAELRRAFPSVPVLALTATATTRVREDIVESLQLRDPRRYVASFNRPNLSYRVVEKQNALKQLLAFVRTRRKESGIIYAASRRQVETLAEKLREAGSAALPYHAGLDPSERSYNQERFVRDDVPVICATVAFGMGINKSNVRYVVHFDLPKNLESYYQETGRAGRDGLPAECVLFYGSSDTAKLLGFIEEKEADERERARDALRVMQHYAEGAECRRAMLLEYFGERLAPGGCTGCDNCLAPRARFDGTVAAQKFLSNVVRVRQASGFSVGLNHLVDVLTGRETEKVRGWNHDALTTYGIGKGTARPEWIAIGRELTRLGLLRQTPGLRSVVELTESGRKTLVERRTVELTAAAVVERDRTSGADDGGSGDGGSWDGGSGDEELFDDLRALRKRIADQRDVPAYVIFPDTTLRAMARDVPASLAELRRIPGVGDKKLADYGEAFLSAIASRATRENAEENA